jgi:hypothetical protein
MSSVLRFLKQRPSDSQYFIALTSPVTLSLFNPDAAASTTSYVSGAAAGNFTQSNVSINVNTAGATSSLSIFRDMGTTIVSSGRTFRRVQLLAVDVNGSSGWSSSNTTAGVWSPTGLTGVGGGGVAGNAGPNSGSPDSAFNVFYFETGAMGLGIAQGLIRYG